MRLRIFVAAVALMGICGVGFGESPVKVVGLRVEQEAADVPVLGIGVVKPRLSWRLESSRAGELQKGYEIRAAADVRDLERQPGGAATRWLTGKVESGQSVLVPWGGWALASRGQVYWQVRVWDKDGEASAWSAPAMFEMGALVPAGSTMPEGWKAQWITVTLPKHDIMALPLAKAKWVTAGPGVQPVGARVVVDLPGEAAVRGAFLEAAADGLITLYVNGVPTRQGSTSHTAPFFTSFGHQLKGGRNVIAIGSGAARGGRGGAARNAIAAHAVIELDNGQKIELNTDEKWKASVAPGENWFAADFNDAAWAAATAGAAYVEAPLTNNAGGTMGAANYLRRPFVPRGPVAKARLYATALGTYEAFLNGVRVSEDRLSPGYTDYTKRVMVQTYDVTKLITAGENVLGAVLTDGWFAGRLGWMGLAQYAQISPRPLFAGQLELTYADGSTEVIATDASWAGGGGEILGSDQQIGETIDARRRVAWDKPGFSEGAFKAVEVDGRPALRNIALVPQVGPPVRKVMELEPKSIKRMGSVWVVDFGQNFVGHVKLRARGAAGTEIDLRHAERLNGDGSLYAENLRTAISVDTFVLRGEGEEVFEPRFTFHGFQFAEVAGYPGELTAEKIRGMVVASDCPPIGTFETSNADVNRLYQNIVWGQRGNFLSVPTDCPQRDERMGWMGDAMAFAPTAALNMDVAGFFMKWMYDVNDGQLANGAFSDISPRVARPAPAWPVWGDAGTVVPWVMYTTYGDVAFLEKNYANMKAWVDFSRGRANGLLLTGGVGDHLAPVAPRGGPRGGAGAGAGVGGGAPRGPATGPAVRGPVAGTPGGRGPGARGPGAVTTTAVVDTAYFANSARIVAKAAAILGKAEDAAAYEKLNREIAEAFTAAYVMEDGTMRAGTQTTYILALQFELVPEAMRAALIKNLVADVETRGSLSTGFVGVGLINPALTAIGRPDLAYKLLLNEQYPSWLFAVKHGATTIWERWDGWTPERGYQDSSMNSFNHYSLGSVGYWMYSGAAGIQAVEGSPGFKKIRFMPQVTDRLGFVKATVDSPYGKIGAHWRREGAGYVYEVVVPPNTTAEVVLPGGGKVEERGAGRHEFRFGG